MVGSPAAASAELKLLTVCIYAVRDAIQLLRRETSDDVPSEVHSPRDKRLRAQALAPVSGTSFAGGNDECDDYH